MSDSKSDPAVLSNALARVRKEIAQATRQFPISQILVPLQDTLDWLLDDVASERYWLDALNDLHRAFAPRWELVAERALGQNPRTTSEQAFQDASFDVLNGSEPWGAELTTVLRATFAELEEFGEEIRRVFPQDERTRAFIRAIRTQTGGSVLPVISYAPLKEIEWQAILDKLNEMIDLALLFEGAVVVWLIGGFARDVEGRLQLRPQLSLTPPPSGYRVKPIRVILGTAYEEQCPSLIPLVQSERAARQRPSDKLLTETPWHRMVVQIDVTSEDYVLLHFDRLSDQENQIARQTMSTDQNPREPYVLHGAVAVPPRPWRPATLQTQAAIAEPATEQPTKTTLLPPRPAVQAAQETQATKPDTQSVRRDAEMLRQKGMAVAKTDPAVAQKYLLASTVLENNSVDVWLTLVEIATNDKQRESFQREAEKVLRRQHRDRTT